MKPRHKRSGKPTNQYHIRYGLEELKFLRSPNDMRIFISKVKYWLPRMIGTYRMHHDVPPSLQIEPTNHCNVECICCPSSRSTRPRGYIDIDLFRHIIDDASAIGVGVVFLFLHGEPMLHPQIIEMIQYLKSKKIAIHLTTNGIPLSKKKIKGILEAGVNSADYITFSIMGSSKEVHEGVMKRGNYDRVVENIHTFLELRRRLRLNGPVIETVFYTMPRNMHEEEEYIRTWRGIVDHTRLGGNISESFSEYKRDRTPLSIRTSTCANLWQKMTIFWNGKVALCCEDIDGDWIIGDLNEQSISEIWNSNKMLNIKKLHKQKKFEKIPLCVTCDMW